MSKHNSVRVTIAVVLVALAAVVLVACSTGSTLQPQGAAESPAESTASQAPASAAATPTADGAGDAAAGAAASSTIDNNAQINTTGSATPFAIDPAASEARFLINETLVGIPTEVKGVTSLVSGTLAIDAADPVKTTVGTITIDARDLRTDRDMRNRAIGRFILESNKDEYRYITFTPTAIAGLPAKAAAGDTFNFQITGDLKIKDVSKPVTFDVEVKADSDTEVSGLAKATVKRSDFNLSIPSAPGVADVTDDVRLELAFTAKVGQG
jgi:polyisoprenoid-binding protein YceI